MLSPDEGSEACLSPHPPIPSHNHGVLGLPWPSLSSIWGEEPLDLSHNIEQESQAVKPGQVPWHSVPHGASSTLHVCPSPLGQPYRRLPTPAPPGSPHPPIPICSSCSLSLSVLAGLILFSPDDSLPPCAVLLPFFALSCPLPLHLPTPPSPRSLTPSFPLQPSSRFSLSSLFYP